MKKIHPTKNSFSQIKFTCNLNLMNFDKFLNKYNLVITCIKMNKN